MKKCVNFIMIIFILFLSGNVAAKGVDIAVNAGFKPGYIVTIDFATGTKSIGRAYYSATVDTSFCFGKQAMHVETSYLMFAKSENDVSILDHTPGVGFALGFVKPFEDSQHGFYINSIMGFGAEEYGGFFLYPNIYYGFRHVVPFTDSFNAEISIDVGFPVCQLGMDCDGNLECKTNFGVFYQFGLLFGWSF